MDILLEKSINRGLWAGGLNFAMSVHQKSLTFLTDGCLFFLQPWRMATTYLSLRLLPPPPPPLPPHPGGHHHDLVGRGLPWVGVALRVGVRVDVVRVVVDVVPVVVVVGVADEKVGDVEDGEEEGDEAERAAVAGSLDKC